MRFKPIDFEVKVGESEIESLPFQTVGNCQIAETNKPLIDESQYEVVMNAEIMPNWKRAGVIVLSVVGIFAFIVCANYLLQTQKALAAESLYRHLDREFPRLDSLVYVPFGVESTCLHLARFDTDTGQFYDRRGWLNEDRWLYVTDPWPPESRTCTSKDMKNDIRF